MKTKREIVSSLDFLKDFFELNKHLNPRLGGSLALALYGIKLNREPKDIDIIVDDASSIRLPKDYTYDNAVLMSADNIGIFHSEGGLIDVLTGTAYRAYVQCDGVKLDNIHSILSAKLEYSLKQKLNDKTREKHLSDLETVLPQILALFPYQKESERWQHVEAQKKVSYTDDDLPF